MKYEMIPERVDPTWKVDQIQLRQSMYWFKYQLSFSPMSIRFIIIIFEERHFQKKREYFRLKKNNSKGQAKKHRLSRVGGFNNLIGDCLPHTSINRKQEISPPLIGVGGEQGGLGEGIVEGKKRTHFRFLPPNY